MRHRMTFDLSRDSRPMMFQDDDAFQRLRERGRVIAARAEEKDERPVWIRRSRTGPKEMDAYREPTDSYSNFAAFTSSNLCRGHYTKAGFRGWREWADVVKELQSGVPDEVRVYRVWRLDNDGD